MAIENAERIDFIVQRGAKFSKEFQLLEDDGITPISLVTKTVECSVKQSFKAAAKLFHLTEANEGCNRLDAENGSFSINIDADKTNIDIDTAFYNIKLIDNSYPTIETERIIEGRLTFTKDV